MIVVDAYPVLSRALKRANSSHLSRKRRRGAVPPPSPAALPPPSPCALDESMSPESDAASAEPPERPERPAAPPEPPEELEFDPDDIVTWGKVI